jgi:hypothetical protein
MRIGVIPRRFSKPVGSIAKCQGTEREPEGRFTGLYAADATPQKATGLPRASSDGSNKIPRRPATLTGRPRLIQPKEMERSSEGFHRSAVPCSTAPSCLQPPGFGIAAIRMPDATIGFRVISGFITGLTILFIAVLTHTGILSVLLRASGGRAGLQTQLQPRKYLDVIRSSSIPKGSGQKCSRVSIKVSC